MTVPAWANDPREFNRRLYDEAGGNCAELSRIYPDLSERTARSKRKQHADGGIAYTPAAKEESGWNLGAPPLVTPATSEEYERVYFILDLHGQFMHEEKFAADLRVIDNWKPHRIVLGGDTHDWHILGRWSEKERARLSQIELRRKIEFEKQAGLRPKRMLREIFTGRIDETEGNHDQRYREWLSPDLQEGWEAAIEDLEYNDLGIHLHTRAGFYLRPDFLPRHGRFTNEHAAKSELMSVMAGGVTGHLHRKKYYGLPIPQAGKKLEHICGPASCRRDAAYMMGHAGIQNWDIGSVMGIFSTTDPYDYHIWCADWTGDALVTLGERF